MLKLLKSLSDNSSGAAFVIVALMLPIILLVMILAIDVGNMQSSKVDGDSATESTANALKEYVAKSSIDGATPSDDELRAYGLAFAKSNTFDQGVAQIDEDKFSVSIDAEKKLTVSSCMLLKDIGLGSAAGFGGNKTVCSASSVNLVCIPEVINSEGPCPSGQSGTIKYRQVKQCPSGNLTAKVVVDSTCKDVCIPTSKDVQSPCPSGLQGLGIVNRINTTCPHNVVQPPVQISYSCYGPECQQRTENKTEQCSDVTENDEATGKISWERTEICPKPKKWGEWIQTDYDCCIPKTKKRKVKCPEGQVGIKKQEREKTCPAGKWGDWKTVKNTCRTPAPEEPEEEAKPDCNAPKNNLLTYEITSYFDNTHGESTFINPYLDDERSDEGQKITFQVSIFKNEKLRIAAGTAHTDTGGGSSGYTNRYVQGFYGSYNQDGKQYQHAAEQLMRVCNSRYSGGDNYRCNGVAKNYQHTVAQHEYSGTDVKAVYEPGMTVQEYVKVTGINSGDYENYVEAKLVSCEELKKEDFKPNKDQVSAAPIYYKKVGEWKLVRSGTGGANIASIQKDVNYDHGTNTCPCKTEMSRYGVGYCGDSNAGEDGFYMRSNMGKSCQIFWYELIPSKGRNNKVSMLRYERQD